MSNNIEQDAVKLYNKNMRYLKKYHEDIFDKVNTLSEMISDGTFKVTQQLEYKNGYFNVLNLETNKYLYKTNHKKYSKKIKTTFDFSNKNGFNTLNEYAYSMEYDTKVSEENKHIRNALAPFTSYINKYKYI